MANGNWQGGSAKGRAQAFAWLRHNDPDHRKEVEHSNREIDKSRTHLNFEVGPTKGLTYVQKCDRIRKIWDEWGYPEDRDLGPVTRNTPTSMQAIDLSAPDDLNNEAALEDGRLESWAEKAVGEAAKLFGEENIIAAYVDVDEQHVYTDAETGEQRLSRFHVHLYVAPVVEKKVVKNQYVYLRPDGTETLDESEAQRVYITVNNAETDDEAKAAINDDGTPKTGPKHARMNNGRRKRKKGKRADATETRRTFSGAEFNTEYIERLNEVIHKMTAREFDGMKWNTHELGTYQRTKGKRNKSVEELKAASVEREVAQRRAEATAEIEQNLAQSEALLDAADADRTRAARERNAAKAEAEKARAEAATAKAEKADAVAVVESAKWEAVQARRVRDLYAGESYQTKDGHTALGTKGLKAENARLRAENERLERNNAAKRSEGERIEKANAARSAALDERYRALKAGEERLAEDRAKLDGDRAEATRLLDGYDRPATEADYLPPHDPANIGERVVAEKRAHDDYWAAYHANGHKPPTVHEPGLRETVKAAKEACAGYEQATEEARRERDGLREFRKGLVKLLEDLCWSVKMAQKEEDNKGHKATARFFKTAHGIFVRALTTLDDAHVPEAPRPASRARCGPTGSPASNPTTGASSINVRSRCDNIINVVLRRNHAVSHPTHQGNQAAARRLREPSQGPQGDEPRHRAAARLQG